MTVKLRLTVAALLLFLVVMVDSPADHVVLAMGCWSAALWYCCGR
ncbi:hypothetical protein ECH7EC4113_2528 [Escherichia coli O157:H7 str. EC4113]|nr:hypothetical protein ECH7EC4113_2528 [Escherichia coli O157:H7 str. EC4113]